MEQLPSSIKILGHDYTVEITPDSEMDSNFGEIWFKKHRIKINTEASHSRRESTLLHEVIEVIDKHFELKLEHRAIETLEEVLYQVLKDNKLHF